MQDNQEGIEQIVWDLYGKVEAINRTTAAASAGKANLAFMHDALGNRTKKQVVEDPYSASPEVHETWYVRDPQGNILANYERFVEGDSLFLYLTERPIYGSARIGVNMRRVKLSASLANQYDPPARAMQITTVMYDSPSSHKDAPEVNDGEYVVLLNTSNDTLDLGAYRLRNLLTNDNWTMTGMGSVAPGQRIMLANYPSGGAASFKTLSLVTDQDLTEGDIRLTDSLGISLWDSAGAIVIEDTFGILHDRMNYGEYFGLDARNAYVATASLGNLGDREPMMAVYRTAGLARPVGGTTPQVWVITTTGTMAGEVSLSPLPTGYTGSEMGTYALERGGTAYEFTNHLGNVLAVVSDKKLGQDTGTDMLAEYYHPETMMLTDYYPFGMAMVGRNWQSGGYRYGFQGQERDDEVVGEGNCYSAEYWLYDGRLARRWNSDPMTKAAPGWSAYRAFYNNPIYWTDPAGAIEYESAEAFAKANKGKTWDRDRGRGDWLKTDRENNTEVWNSANKYNLGKEDGYLQYNTITQRTAFYGWFQMQTDGKGFETNWAGAAYIVAQQMSLMDEPLIAWMTDPAVIKFANDGNKAIFDDVFDNLRDLYNGCVLKGDDAAKWDAATLIHEQRDVVQPIYERQTLETLLKLQSLAEGKGIKAFLGFAFDRRFPIGGPLKFEGNIFNWQDRYNQGMNKVVPFYRKYGSIFNWNKPGDYRFDTPLDPDNPGLLRHGEPKF